MARGNVQVDIVVNVTLFLEQAIGVVTALEQYDLDDDDVGGADDLREFYVRLRDALKMPEPSEFVETGEEGGNEDANDRLG